MRLFLVRHGQTAWNILGKAQGHTDIPLDAAGLEQRAQLAQSFEGVRVDRILCSDLQRARQTAEVLQGCCPQPIEYTQQLRERCFGDWEGQNFEDVRTWQTELAAERGLPWVQVGPPNGESLVDVWHRTLPLMDSIRERRESVLIVSHGGTCAVMLAQLVRAPVETARSFRFGNTAVAELELRQDDLLSLLRYNDTSHLALPAPRVESLAR